ncbi:MAG: Rrf2 family transcriptional regulator [Thermodesulfobacteriota bacterium]
MQVSKTLDYALRSLTLMSSSPVSTYRMKDISEQRHIPLNYLAKIMRKLVNKGIVRSRVGPDGGYVLEKPPSDINLKDVYEAIEGEMRVVDCMDKDTLCTFYESCPQIPVWDKLHVSLTDILKRTTIEDMVKQNHL